jgi:methionyl aminopeptidase
MAVRARTRKAVHMIAEQITPGMSEDEAKEIARPTLASLEMRRGWHHIIVRCGSNTTKDFMERSEPGVVLQDNDIFFIDIGPVYGDFEGDAGDTFVFGDNPLHLKAKRTSARSGRSSGPSGSPSRSPASSCTSSPSRPPKSSAGS